MSVYGHDSGTRAAKCGHDSCMAMTRGHVPQSVAMTHVCGHDSGTRAAKCGHDS